VAGKSLSTTEAKASFPRMLQVRYVLSFDFSRAGAVYVRNRFCCPGALAGYRKSVVREVLDEWMEQTFLAACAPTARIVP